VKFLRFDNGTYAVVDTNVNEATLAENNNNRRLQLHAKDPPSFSSSVSLTDVGSLLFGSDENEYQYHPIEPLHHVDSRTLQEVMAVNNSSAQFVFGRMCTCARGTADIYCPLEAELCRVWDSSGLVYGKGHRVIRCEGKTQDIHVRFLFPVGLFTMMLLLFYLAVSRKGWYALTYLARLFLCCNEEQYQHALREEVDVQIRLAEIRAAQTAEPVLETRKVKATLKTQLYKQGCGLQQDCMICLADFEPEDRVGKLPCNHTFHVDCLKEWVKRKNHCPLCHTENLALPTSERSVEVY
jgi:hypothetical protein